MRWCAGIIGFLALLIVLLPDLGAQDQKAPPVADAKAADKIDPEKKDADKADAKKKETKKEPDEKVVYGQTYTGRLKRMDPKSARDFTIEVSQLDQVKVNALNIWQTNEMNRIATRVAPQQRPQQMAQHQRDLARKNTEVYSPKDIDLRAADNCKFRSMFPPTEFDDKGRPKVWKQKELNALKGNSKLRGYPADFDRLNVGQTVTAYLAKTKGLTKGEAAKKKNSDDDDQVKPEVVMIVVEKEAPAPK
jgi:hypothetical protein